MSRWRWHTVWRLMTGRWSEPDGTDIAEARRSHIEEQYELQHAMSRRPAVEHAAQQIRKAHQERDFTALVEETFMPVRR